MFRNCLAAALRHLARNKLYTVISLLGLSIGLGTALLATLLIQSELNKDHFIPGYDRVYVVTSAITPPGHSTVYYDSTLSFVGGELASRFSEIQAVTRLYADHARLRRGMVEALEPVYWADPNAFDVLPLPVVAGDLKLALSRPDRIVLTRSVARKYFGGDAPLGETLTVQVPGSAQIHQLSVAAVIEDLPANDTHLVAGIFVSSLAPWTALNPLEAVDPSVARTQLGVGTHTYVKLMPHATARRMLPAMPTMAQAVFTGPPRGWTVALGLVRMDRLGVDSGLNPGWAARMLMLTIVGFGVPLIAGINFINLLTARSGQRVPEVSLRKLAGARRRDLVVQFLAESIAYVSVASLMAVALVELVLPHANAFVMSGAAFSFRGNPALIGAIVLGTLVLGALAGAYPALVQSDFIPLRVLSGRIQHSRRAGVLRQVLVTLQFAILIGLTIAAAVVYQQRQFATRDALRVDTDQILLIRSRCDPAFLSQLRTMPGIRGAACSASPLVDHAGVNVLFVKDRTGAQQLLYPIYVQPSLLALYGIRPIAGRAGGRPGGAYYLLNETAARQLGFTRSADAIGYRLPAYGRDLVTVAGVIRDFSLDSVQHRIEAQGFVVTESDPHLDLISVKLSGHDIPETLDAIERLWKTRGAEGPMNRFFLEDHIQTMYLAMLREAQLFGIFALVAVLLACLGLLALASSIAERRTREIGIRKALGADTGEIVSLLLRQFARPVLWANLIAWPLTAYVMHSWLHGFAYHVELALWPFPAAAALALVIALLTVATHSILIARAKPMHALRYQ